MAAPFPPQGQQKQHTERPIKIYGEQYLDGQPLPVGAVVNPLGPGDLPLFSDGLPRVALPSGRVVMHLTDFVISSRYTGQPIEVISADEFTERFGPSELT